VRICYNFFCAVMSFVGDNKWDDPLRYADHFNDFFFVINNDSLSDIS